MKTTMGIPEDELLDAMRFTQARTKGEAVVTATAEFNRRRRVAEPPRHAGTCPVLMTPDDLARARCGE